MPRGVRRAQTAGTGTEGGMDTANLTAAGTPRKRAKRRTKAARGGARGTVSNLTSGTRARNNITEHDMAVFQAGAEWGLNLGQRGRQTHVRTQTRGRGRKATA